MSDDVDLIVTPERKRVYADLMEAHGFLVRRPPGFWPWAADKILDAKRALRDPARRFAARQLHCHGVSCKVCQLGNAFKPHPYLDASVCVACGHVVTGIEQAVAWGRPIRLWLRGA